MTPYSALFGALKVADEVEVELDAGLLPRAEEATPSYERDQAARAEAGAAGARRGSLAPRSRRTTSSTRAT